MAEPRAETFYSDQVYRGGALALYALRQEVGRRTFERIEREWVRRYEHRSASTADYIALASEVAGRLSEKVLLVRPGVPADVDLDAVPGEAYSALVSAVDVSPTSSAGGGVTYRVRLALTGLGEPLLKPLGRGTVARALEAAGVVLPVDARRH